jgi:hypothetical protein
VHGHEIGARGKGPLDHQLGERADHGRLHMATAQQRLAHVHEVGDGVVAIADELGGSDYRREQKRVQE